MNFGIETKIKRNMVYKFLFTIMFTCLLFLANQTSCFATTVTLQWNPNTDTNLAGYKVYYQANSSTQPFQGTGATQGASPLTIGNLTTATISGLNSAQAYYFAVTAYYTSGVESAYSNIVYVPSLTPTKIGVFEYGQWYLDLNGNGSWDGTSTDTLSTFGTAGDIPVFGDWDGSGTTKKGVFNNGTWILDMNGKGTANVTYNNFGVGLTGAVPVTGDWTGNGTTKIGVFVNGTWYLDLNGNGVWDGTPTDGRFNFGTGVAGAVPVTGDWTGNAITKIGIFANGTWYLDLNGNGAWDGTPTDGLFNFGTGVAGAIPVTGDWTGNGTGTTKIGVFVPGTGLWYVDYNGNGVWDGTSTDKLYSFGGGVTGAVPVTGKW